jgi:pimeloyl-ACP methyl ester carboxylesterase
VKQAIERRELFSLNCQGVVIHGTYHVPAADIARPNRTGILILAGFPMPRAAHGDAAVSWADSFASLGYPSFRIDLPGSGDSEGVVPPEQLFEYVNAGKHERVTVEVVKQLVELYNLTGVVALGHCAGAVAGIFAAAICADIRGLVVMDPQFHLPPAGRPKVTRALFEWSSLSRFGGILHNIYDRLNYIRLQLRKNRPPENANFPMLKRWKDLASAGLPILMLNAPEPKAQGTKPRIGKFDYISHIRKLAGNRNRLEIRIIESAHHTFSDPVGREAIRLNVEQWLPTFFPFQNQGPAAAEVAQPMPINSKALFAENESMMAHVDATLGN